MDKFLGINDAYGYRVFNTETELKEWAQEQAPESLKRWVFRRLGPKIDLTVMVEVAIK